MGILFTFQTAERSNSNWPGLAYFSVSLSLNVLLTLMIVIRLILHTRNTRNALGIAGIGGLCKTVVTMLIESCALYAVGSVLVIGPWSVQNTVASIFLVILSQTQVRTFPQPRASDNGLSNMTGVLRGHRPIAHHSTSRQQERIDEQKSRLRTSQFFQSEEPRGVDGCEWCRSW